MYSPELFLGLEINPQETRVHGTPWRLPGGVHVRRNTIPRRGRSIRMQPGWKKKAHQPWAVAPLVLGAVCFSTDRGGRCTIGRPITRESLEYLGLVAALASQLIGTIIELGDNPWLIRECSRMLPSPA